MKKTNKYVNLSLTIGVSLILGVIIMLLLGYNPLEAYYQLVRGAFVGKLNFGTTLQKFVPLLITSLAFAVTSKAGGFNVGVEGELYLGAMAAALVGIWVKGVPAPIHMLLCFLAAGTAGALWAYIPGALKAKIGVNEICVTILMNYVAKYLTSYLANGPFSAKTGTPQTPQVPDNIRLYQFMAPSKANMGIIIGILVTVGVFWLIFKSTSGYEITSVGLNRHHADYIGIDSKKVLIRSFMIGGALGGIAGAIEVLGVYGYYLDNFSTGIASDGMLAALIVKNDIKMIPFMVFFLSVLKSGALGMERYTGVPKSIVDTIIAVFIIFATMDGLFQFGEKRKLKKPTTQGV